MPENLGTHLFESLAFEQIAPDELDLGLGLVGAAAEYPHVPAVIAQALDHQPSERSRYPR